MHKAMVAWRMLRKSGREFAPYLMLEILLPGGSLVALSLFLYRRSRLKAASVLAHNAPKIRAAAARPAHPGNGDSVPRLSCNY
jgi:hypothetical protein